MYQLPLSQFQSQSTPFYYYDLNLLDDTLRKVKQLIEGKPYVVHYAVKANSNPVILRQIAASGLGADLVSGGEMQVALQAGFQPQHMMFAGVGKTDQEINLGLDNDIACFNVESVPELEVINALAAARGRVARVAIRVNPDIDAHTHSYITTGTAANKFGVGIELLSQVVELAQSLPCIELIGLHFHIGSQITLMEPYRMLCERINELLDFFDSRNVHFKMIDVGGGLGVDYEHPDTCPMAPFEPFFDTFTQHLHLREGQQLHFELGRAIVAQCGSLIASVVFVKENRNKRFVILDAGMTQLVRPALYQAHHLIQNLSADADAPMVTYDVVGPVCESSDVFGHDEELPLTSRGHIFAIRSAGAYGEVMASQYNMRPLPPAVFSR
ncbi:MAG: diaminopimelate decarboxylase [Muribaculaceae bacterium]|nr:diaminopimelate decarboxylase [Muribaculaceae bacterium]